MICIGDLLLCTGNIDLLFGKCAMMLFGNSAVKVSPTWVNVVIDEPTSEPPYHFVTN